MQFRGPQPFSEEEPAITFLLFSDSIGGVLTRVPTWVFGGASPRLGAPAVWEGGCGQDLLALSAVTQGLRSALGESFQKLKAEAETVVLHPGRPLASAEDCT